MSVSSTQQLAIFLMICFFKLVGKLPSFCPIIRALSLYISGPPTSDFNNKHRKIDDYIWIKMINFNNKESVLGPEKSWFRDGYTQQLLLSDWSLSTGDCVSFIAKSDFCQSSSELLTLKCVGKTGDFCPFFCVSVFITSHQPIFVTEHKESLTQSCCVYPGP